MNSDPWAGADVASLFVDGAYATVKGYVRTYVLHQQLLEHLPPPPAAVLDVGGGAGHQSFPLAVAGYPVTLLDSSPAMLEKARERLAGLPAAARDRVTIVQGDGLHAAATLAGRRFAAVLCHGVLGYLDEPTAMIAQLCACADEGGLVSIMTGNAAASAVQPALERRWADALAALGRSAGDTGTGTGTGTGTATAPVPGLGIQGRADSVGGLSAELRRHGVEPVRWYGVWLFVDWLGFSGVALDPGDPQELAAIAAVELRAARLDPYRRLSRAVHLVGRKVPAAVPGR